MSKKQAPPASRHRTFRHSLATESENAPAVKRKGRPPKKESPAADREVMTATGERVILSAHTQRLIEDVRAEFSHFSTDFGTLTQSRADLAPKYMKAFRAWEKETGGTFVAFARFMDPSIPEDRDGYRAHPSYQAAENLRSIERAQLAGPVEKPKNAPVTPLQALARVVATFLPILENGDIIWNAFQKQLHWNEAQLKRLQDAVRVERALVRLVGRGEQAPTLKSGTNG